MCIFIIYFIELAAVNYNIIDVCVKLLETVVTFSSFGCRWNNILRNKIRTLSSYYIIVIV